MILGGSNQIRAALDDVFMAESGVLWAYFLGTSL